jgi:hypothetical protein
MNYKIEIDKENLNHDQILILPIEYVTKLSIDNERSENYIKNKKYTRLNKSGWKISAEISADYYTWVEYFEAVHKKYGIVRGDFNDFVYASSKEAYDDFIKNHPYEIFCIGDI